MGRGDLERAEGLATLRFSGYLQYTCRGKAFFDKTRDHESWALVQV